MILRQKWLSIPNFYAVQRGTPRSFKPVSDGVINLYLYINIHTDSGARPKTIFGCSLCKTHPCNELCSARFHAKIRNIKKQTRKGSLWLWGECTVYLTKVWLCKFFSCCNYNQCSCHHISVERATILEAVICFLKPSYKKIWVISLA